MIWVTPTTTFAYFYKLFHDAIIIPVSSDPLHLETVEREKITKKWIPWEQKEVFRWNKNHFPKLLKCFLLVKYKKEQVLMRLTKSAKNYSGNWFFLPSLAI